MPHGIFDRPSITAGDRVQTLVILAAIALSNATALLLGASLLRLVLFLAFEAAPRGGGSIPSAERFALGHTTPSQ